MFISLKAEGAEVFAQGGQKGDGDAQNPSAEQVAEQQAKFREDAVQWFENFAKVAQDSEMLCDKIQLLLKGAHDLHVQGSSRIKANLFRSAKVTRVLKSFLSRRCNAFKEMTNDRVPFAAAIAAEYLLKVLDDAVLVSKAGPDPCTSHHIQRCLQPAAPFRCDQLQLAAGSSQCWLHCRKHRTSAPGSTGCNWQALVCSRQLPAAGGTYQYRNSRLYHAAAAVRRERGRPEELGWQALDRRPPPLPPVCQGRGQEEARGAVQAAGPEALGWLRLRWLRQLWRVWWQQQGFRWQEQEEPLWQGLHRQRQQQQQPVC